MWPLWPGQVIYPLWILVSSSIKKEQLWRWKNLFWTLKTLSHYVIYQLLFFISYIHKIFWVSLFVSLKDPPKNRHPYPGGVDGRADECTQWEEQCSFLGLIDRSTLFEPEKQKIKKVIVRETKKAGDSWSFLQWLGRIAKCSYKELYLQLSQLCFCFLRNSYCSKLPGHPLAPTGGWGR